jgi:hypothetical protein
MAQLKEGQHLKVSGTRSVPTPKFGAQVKAESFEAIAPSTTEGIEAYLASGLVRGIGPATAKKIVQAFGSTRCGSSRISRSDCAVCEASASAIEELSGAVRAQKDLQNVLVFLRSHGLGPALAARIVRRYGANASALVQANPYRLADERIGIGFRTRRSPRRPARHLAAGPRTARRSARVRLGPGREGRTLLPARSRAGAAHLRTAQRGRGSGARAGAGTGARGPHRAPTAAGPGCCCTRIRARSSIRALAVAEDGVARALDDLVRSPHRPLPCGRRKPCDLVREALGHRAARRANARRCCDASANPCR